MTHMTLPTITVYDDDPDAHVPRTIINRDGVDLAFVANVAVDSGVYNLVGTWEGALSSVRVLKVPVSSLPPGEHDLYLQIPNDNDVWLGKVLVVVRD